jgi:tRNA U34 2-thiouridine synthase MnmA/TrmU
MNYKLKNTVLIAVLILTPFYSTQAAQLDFDNQIVEVTPGPSDEQIDAKFHFVNSSGNPVILESTGTSCGCTIVDVETRKYLPNEGGNLSVRYIIGDRSGIQMKNVSVFTMSKDVQEHAVLTIKVHLVEGPTVTPAIVDWHIGEEKEPKIATVTFGDASPYRIVGIHCDNETFTAQLLATIDQKRHY